MAGIDIVSLSRNVVHYVIEQRRYFHCHPEPTSREFKTMKYIQNELDQMKIPYTNIPDGGILAEIAGSGSGKDIDPHVLLRADCDALTMEEAEENMKQKRTCMSENHGVAHMCGHDSHMAMLLGAAKILSELKPEQIAGTIYLLFERGEEGGNCIYYVMKYIQHQNIRIDSCFALHVEPDLPAGIFGVAEGPSHAGNVNFEIKLIGKGGHGSRPDLSNHPLDCFISIVNQLKDIRMKYIKPSALITYNIGSIKCGEKRNIIPENLEFKGTARFFDVEAGSVFKERLDAIIRSNAALYDCKTEYQVFSGPSLSLKNNKEAVELAEDALKELYGERQLEKVEPSLGSESFSTLGSYYPSVMLRLGVRNEKQGMMAALHSPWFDLDESALMYGVSSHVAYALKYLEKAPQISFTPFPGDADAVLAFTHRPVPKHFDEVL